MQLYSELLQKYTSSCSSSSSSSNRSSGSPSYFLSSSDFSYAALSACLRSRRAELGAARLQRFGSSWPGGGSTERHVGGRQARAPPGAVEGRDERERVRTETNQTR
eukprot:GHVT01075408.1.p2 GENE.GHVT01075408.1~~GHVT01075408.1.p2  ORF type:complete len:106 (-),score=24.46 GHVT01075408.1:748-1065(-)